jgi:hypothetical protein
MSYIAAYWGSQKSKPVPVTEGPSRRVCKVMDEDDPLKIEVCMEDMSGELLFKISDKVSPKQKRLKALIDVRKKILDFHKYNVDLRVPAGKKSTFARMFLDEFLTYHRS